MPLTSADLDVLLLRRCAKKLAYAGLDATTADGTSPSLGDGKVEGLRSLGLTPLGPLNLVDADLVGVADASVPQLLDVAELRTLENILGNRAAPDQVADTNNEQYHGRFYDSLEKTVERKREQVERQYGIGLGSLSAGVLDLGFAETIDPATGRPD